MKKTLGIFILLFLGPFGWAEVKPFMDQMLDQIFTLKPFIVSETAFKDPKNSETITAALKNMVSLSEQINHENKIQRSGYQISGKVLNQQLRETEQVFELGNKDYSLWLLKSTLGVCMSCHTQLPAVSTKFNTFNQARILSNPFEEAEFLFVIRNFKEAMPLYNQSLAGYPGNVVSPDSLEKAVYRQLFYYVRVERDFKALVSVLQADQKNKALPKSLLKEIHGLELAANKMKAEKFPSFTDQQEAALTKYVEEALSSELSGHFSFDIPSKELTYLKVSGVLYEYLDAYPGTHLKPSILYWLSFCETHYTHQAFYSLPELYLKQCVLDFPKNPIAKKCLKEYQDLVTMAFTGSSGAHVPEDIAKELRTMRDLVEKIDN